MARNFAHAFVVAALEPSGWFLADDLEVVVSELVTEALQATPSRIDLAVDVHFDRLHITLGHDGSRSGERPDAVSTLRRSILDVLATGHVTSADARGGHNVSAEIRFDTRHAVSVTCDRRTAAAPGR